MGTNDAAINELKKAFSRQELNLHLGAGVSVASKLPTWDKLVLAMYFDLTSQQRMKGWRPFPNYLYAIAEWSLKNTHEPLEITARKLQKYFCGDDGRFDNAAFIDRLHDILYLPYLERIEYGDPQLPFELLERNNSLTAVSKLIKKTAWGHKGVRAVITYNYDNLLETALEGFPSQSIYQETSLIADQLPIYHVHGYVPFGQKEIAHQQDIVFTEDQYHRIARDPYHWSSLVQVQSIAGGATLMIGLSMVDRNMRRILDAVASAPVASRNYAILLRPEFSSPGDDQLDLIHEKAKEYFSMFEQSGVKSAQGPEDIMRPAPNIKSDQPVFTPLAGIKGGPRYRFEIGGIMEQVHALDIGLQEYIFEKLGVTPLWIDDFDEIPRILQEISSD